MHATQCTWEVYPIKTRRRQRAGVGRAAQRSLVLLVKGWLIPLDPGLPGTRYVPNQLKQLTIGVHNQKGVPSGRGIVSRENANCLCNPDSPVQDCWTSICYCCSDEIENPERAWDRLVWLLGKASGALPTGTATIKLIRYDCQARTLLVHVGFMSTNHFGGCSPLDFTAIA